MSTQINGALAQLLASLQAMPQHTCSKCGASYQGVPALTCWDCDQREIQAQATRRRTEQDLGAIDRRFLSATVAGYRCPPGDAKARDVVSGWDASQGMYLSGPPGAGKSHLAFARAVDLIAEGKRVFASEWTTLLRRLKATYDGRPGESEGDVWATMDRADVVIIDDVMTGREKPTDWAVEQAWQLIHGRYQTGQPLLLTANYTLPGLAQRIGGIDGDRITSRLAEMCLRVEVRAQDYRLQGARR